MWLTWFTFVFLKTQKIAFMKKIVKSEIKTTIEKALQEVVDHLKIDKPSRKTRKAIARVTKSLRTDLKKSMKKEIKSATSHSKKTTKAKEHAGIGA